MKKMLLFTVIILYLAMAPFAARQQAAAAAPSFTTLQPGQFLEIEQNLQVNILFVGYGGVANVNQTILRSWLPASYSSINRAPSYFQRELSGNRFTFSYNIVSSNASFDDAFFGYLSSIAVPKPRTDYQDRYNQQQCRRLNIGQNYEIDSILAEKWLAENADSMLGVNTSQYTVIFVNWYGRPDFKFHVYTNTRERDIDLGTDLSQQFFSHTIGGGGTPAGDPETPLGSLRRVWFYDLSAGPEYNTANWLLMRGDVDGDGLRDWRMPPIWEYGNSSCYRPFNTLSSDHGRLVRYVAINQLFTTSPLYRVSLSPPKLPSAVQFDVNIYEGNPERNGGNLFTPAVATSKLSSLQPFNQFSTEVTHLPFDGEAKRAFECNYFNVNCFGNRYPGNLFFGSLFIYHDDHILQFLEGDADYEIPAFAYLTSDDYANGFFGGAAISDYRTGTQAYIMDMLPEFYFDDVGIGLTTNLLHEAGHHLGLSHPHDGYDSEQDIITEPSGSLFFIWAGDSSSTAMSYNAVNADFSQFDRDNMARFFTAAYINHSNSILARILASPRSNEVSDLLVNADNQATNALSAYQNMDYAQAVVFAKGVYVQILSAAAAITVPIEKPSWQADHRATSPNEMFHGAVDDIRSSHHRRRP